jgi:hypothetical protein
MQSSQEVSFNTSFLVIDLNKAYQLFVISVLIGVITDYGVCHSTPLQAKEKNLKLNWACREKWRNEEIKYVVTQEKL